MKKMLMLVLAAVMLLSMTAAASADTFRVGVKQDVYGFGYLDEMTGEYSGLEIDLFAKIA